MRFCALLRRRVYWIISAAVVILIIYKLNSRQTLPTDFPVLRKSFIHGGKNIQYGPFISEHASKTDSNNHTVTLATHTSVNNLYRLQIISLVWNSPISVAVWAHGDLTELVELAYLLTLVCSEGRSLSISILVPTSKPHQVDVTRIDWRPILNPDAKTCSQRNLHNRFYSLRALETGQNYARVDRLPYPNNRLRNVALKSVRTSHVLVADIDMTPSIDMDNHLMRFFHHETDNNINKAYVVPVFESKGVNTNQWNIARLLTEWQSGKVRQFYVETCPQCQGGTQYTKWIEKQTADYMEMKSRSVPYVPGWEPFIVMSVSSHPTYDERFQQFGYNRMSLICQLHMSGVTFDVMDKVFLMHDGFKTEEGFHAEKDKELKENEMLYMQFRSEISLKYNTKRQC